MSMLTAVSAFTRTRRISPVVRALYIGGLLAVSVLIALLASADFLSNFKNFVLTLLMVFTPWSAINLVDFCLISKERVDIPALYRPEGRYGRWNGVALTCYAFGILAQVPFLAQKLYTGPITNCPAGADVAPRDSDRKLSSTSEEDLADLGCREPAAVGAHLCQGIKDVDRDELFDELVGPAIGELQRVLQIAHREAGVSNGEVHGGVCAVSPQAGGPHTLLESGLHLHEREHLFPRGSRGRLDARCEEADPVVPTRVRADAEEAVVVVPTSCLGSG